MEILKTLQESANDLIPEDLDFFETELATGEGYSDAYKTQCKEKIDQIRKWMLDKYKPKANPDLSDNIVDVLDISELFPEDYDSEYKSLTPLKKVIADISSIRNKQDYKSAFKDYIKDSSIVTVEFLDNNLSIFEKWELDAIASVKQLGEEFLDKYFESIDPDKIARYQEFSEEFFMKHYSQLDEKIVLKEGKNEWRKAEKMSKQLNVFLRLKGVRI